MAETDSLDNDSVEASPDPSASTLPAAEPRVAVGDCLGRYTVRASIGAGGMGEVFEGWDPQLERSVALKVLKAGYGGGSPEARARFQREALAMARLNHPNVVAVHDVGTISDRVFVAMELVRGPTLAEWIENGPHRWREVVAIFLEAGRGLQAAHDAGIVHRDFKPRNVILGDRVRVADFGLARSFGEVESGGASSPTLLDHTITQTGKVLGTPAYMAPEQREGGVVTAHSDQFAFCVALDEALKGTLTPRWLAALVARGRSVETAERYPSMRALLVELGRDRTRVRRWLLVALGAAALLGLPVVLLRHDPASPCGRAAARFAGTWDAKVKTAVHAAFSATKLPYAEDSWRRVSARLDDYATGWRDIAEQTCRATRVEGTQSDSLMDLRMECLERRRAVLDGLTALWSRGLDPDGLEHAGDAASRLPDLGECADTRGLGERLPMPADATAKDQIAKARAQVDGVRALLVAQRWKAAQTRSADARAEADATGWAPIRAEAAFTAGDALYNLADPGAEEQLKEAARLAGEAHDDRLHAQALIDLVDHLARDQQSAARALLVADVAAGAVARVGGDRNLEARLLRGRASALEVGSKFDEARQLLLRARELATESSEVITIVGRLTDVAISQGRYADARQLGEDNLAATTRILGPEHPRTASILNALGNSMLRAGDNEAAAGYYRRALAIIEKVAGPDSAPTATVLNNLGSAELLRGHLEDARANLERALTIRERVLGPEHGNVAQTLGNLAQAWRKQGRYDEALALSQRGLAIAIKVYGPDHARVVNVLIAIGSILDAKGDASGALGYYRRAHEAGRAALGSEHPRTLAAAAYAAGVLAELHRCAEAVPLAASIEPGLEKSGGGSDLPAALVAHARCDLEAGRAMQAEQQLDRAIRILVAAQAGPYDLGATRWVQARALWALHRRDEALAAARTAEAELASDADGAKELAGLRAWLAQRR